MHWSVLNVATLIGCTFGTQGSAVRFTLRMNRTCGISPMFSCKSSAHRAHFSELSAVQPTKWHRGSDPFSRRRTLAIPRVGLPQLLQAAQVHLLEGACAERFAGEEKSTRGTYPSKILGRPPAAAANRTGPSP